MRPQAKTPTPALPFVFVNMAMTSDGKIATANRAVHSFGSARDLRHLYELRATADAVICGAHTIEISRSILDNGGPRYDRLRIKHGLAKHNLRIIVTGSGSIDTNARIFQEKFSPVIVLTTSRISQTNLLKLRAVADEVKLCGRSQINFHSAFRWLREKWNVRRLLCEGGGELNDALFRAGLVDQIHLTICPKIFGGRTAPTIADGGGFLTLAQAKRFELTSMHEYDSELFTVFSRPDLRQNCQVF
jgi:riboflavin-specific deaminase-like protein